MRSIHARHLIIASLIVCLTLIIVISPARAERATVDEMDLVSQNWLARIVTAKGQWAEVSAPKIDKVEEMIENDTLLARVYSISPDGYIIVPAIKELPPIKTYSDEGHFDINQNFGFPQMIKEVLMDRLRNFVSRFGSLEYTAKTDPGEKDLAYHTQQWDQIAVSAAEFKSNLDKAADETMADVGPLLTTRWHQEWPYNINCPYGDGGQTVVGCVATAAAQIMAYHQWPPEGEGTKTYYWNGDNSCDGSTSGQQLYADFSDSYDWINIIDYCSGCTVDQQNALAELCYEVGVAFNMDYGYCGSGAYTDDAIWVYPTYFRYLDIIDKEDRTSHNASSWFYTIMTEIDAQRPLQYRISSHSIVADGYRIVDDLYQIHINYGWGGSYNAWYTVDNLYCSWDGCDPMVEYLIRYITPDKGVTFTADTTVGWAPFDVQFTGESELAVESWLWEFGDGDTSSLQSPLHNYDNPGIYDVELSVFAEGESHSYIKSDFIIALADTIRGGEVEGPLDSTLEIAVNVVNHVPLYRLQIPFEYDGEMDIKYLGYISAGTRSENFVVIEYLNYDGNNKRFTLNFDVGENPDLEPGSGTFIFLKFAIEGTSPGVDTVSLRLDGYNTYEPHVYSRMVEFQPILKPGLITYTGCCIGSTGNTNCSAEEEPDISDITRLIDYLYVSHDPLCCFEEADANASGGTEPDISDITTLIDYLYLTHETLPDCQ
ncbi:MAG: C10 family peptidase [Candidatus Zixiibacteriota bacterium]